MHEGGQILKPHLTLHKEEYCHPKRGNSKVCKHQADEGAAITGPDTFFRS